MNILDALKNSKGPTGPKTDINGFLEGDALDIVKNEFRALVVAAEEHISVQASPSAWLHLFLVFLRDRPALKDRIEEAKSTSYAMAVADLQESVAEARQVDVEAQFHELRNQVMAAHQDGYEAGRAAALEEKQAPDYPDIEDAVTASEDVPVATGGEVMYVGDKTIVTRPDRYGRAIDPMDRETVREGLQALTGTDEEKTDA